MAMCHKIRNKLKHRRFLSPYNPYNNIYRISLHKLQATLQQILLILGEAPDV